MEKQFTLGSLFDGSGTALLCTRMLGMKPVWASEIEPSPIKVTKKNFPDVKHLGDITKINGAEIEPVDVIVGGSPCQDISNAGSRKGLSCGERSSLFFEQIRVIKEMRDATNGLYPKYAVWENVIGAFSSGKPKGADFRQVLQSFCEIAGETVAIPQPKKWLNAGLIRGGYGKKEYSVAWRTFNSKYWGVPQNRRRIFLVASFGGGRAGEILFEREMLCRDFEPCGALWEGIAFNHERSVDGSC